MARRSSGSSSSGGLRILFATRVTNSMRLRFSGKAPIRLLMVKPFLSFRVDIYHLRAIAMCNLDGARAPQLSAIRRRCLGVRIAIPSQIQFGEFETAGRTMACPRRHTCFHRTNSLTLNYSHPNCGQFRHTSTGSFIGGAAVKECFETALAWCALWDPGYSTLLQGGSLREHHLYIPTIRTSAAPRSDPKPECDHYASFCRSRVDSGCVVINCPAGMSSPVHLFSTTS
ncbi:hypothetical protein Tco_0299051 [Tanacetum coccineum]